MAENRIDITSTALEKAFDAATDFLSRLIMSAVEETGYSDAIFESGEYQQRETQNT